jgi:hypothetical protein
MRDDRDDDRDDELDEFEDVEDYESTCCTGVDLGEIFDIMVSWAQHVVSNKERIEEIIGNDRESKALMKAVMTMVSEVGFMNANYQHLIIRISNAVKTSNSIGSVLQNKHGEAFAEAVPPPPVGISCFVVRRNKEDLN